MKISEIVCENEMVGEIARLSRSGFSGGKHQLMGSPRNRRRRLPGGSGLLYDIVKHKSLGKEKYSIEIFDPEGIEEKNQLVSELIVYPVEKFPLKDAVQVDIINVDEDYRGMRLATAMYGIVLTIMKRPLLAGSSQTPGGRKNWVSLSNIPGVEMRGYVVLPDKAIDPDARHSAVKKNAEKNIDILMGDLGAEYLGTVGNSNKHVFTFDVSPNMSNTELEAAVKTKLSRVYGDYYPFMTGLYAVWTGADS